MSNANVKQRQNRTQSLKWEWPHTRTKAEAEQELAETAELRKQVWRGRWHPLLDGMDNPGEETNGLARMDS